MPHDHLADDLNRGGADLEAKVAASGFLDLQLQHVYGQRSRKMPTKNEPATDHNRLKF
jgi:hypothetical protein